MTLVPIDPETVAPRHGRGRVLDAEPAHVSYWRRALRWLAVPSRAYTVLVLAGAVALVIGLALIYVPLAFIVAGLGGGLLGLLGIGLTVRGTTK